MAKYYSTTLQKGSKGGEVTEWQKFLQSQGYYNGSIDGDFGDNTYAATVAYQKANGLGADGIVGENTWGKAGYKLSPSSQDWSYKDFSYDDFSYDDFSYDAYTESDTVTKAGDALDAHIANKPGEYQSQWQSQLDALMNSIMNRDKFSYDVNGDALYQQYKDKYIQQGKMAMADTMGQAAAMTGGYGNSYAQSVGQQAYQASLDNLNDIVPELYAMALEQYNREGQELYNQYGMLSDRENLDYGRYRDKVSDYLTERDYLAGRYDSERDYDYSKYDNERDFAYSQYSSDRALDYEKYSSDRDLAYDEYATDKNLSYEEYRAAIADEQWQKSFDASQAAALASGGGSGGGSGNGGGAIYNSDGTLKEGYTTSNESYFDKNGNFKKATFSRIDSNGNAVWYIDGKEVIRQQGANPYTGDVNPDAKNGTFSNGYQPNNVNGQKLSKSGITDTVNGVTQNVWKTPDGTLWIWDGTQNKYLKYGNSPTKTTQPTKATSGGGGGGSRVKVTLN